jgi:hypothetical protein
LLVEVPVEKIVAVEAVVENLKQDLPPLRSPATR